MVAEIRPLDEKDLPQAARLLTESWQQIFAEWIPEDIVRRVNEDSALTRWKEIRNRQDCFQLGAFSDDQLLGTLVWGKAREDKSFDLELYSMLIDPRHHAKKIGRSLFRSFLLEAEKQGARNFYLNCIDANEKALGFYRHMGGRTLSGKISRGGYHELRLYWLF